jgi:hypothetical protein
MSEFENQMSAWTIRDLESKLCDMSHELEFRTKERDQALLELVNENRRGNEIRAAYSGLLKNYGKDCEVCGGMPGAKVLPCTCVQTRITDV